MTDNVFSVRDALKQARRFYDELSLSPLEAAAKYGPDYEPVTDEECLEVRRMIDVAIPLVDKIEEAARLKQFEEDCEAAENLDVDDEIALIGNGMISAYLFGRHGK